MANEEKDYDFEDIENDIPEVEDREDILPQPSPIMEITTQLQNPENVLTASDKENLKFLANSENAVKISLVNLFMDQFKTVKNYDETINKLVDHLGNKMTALEPYELINLLGVLSKSRSTEAKNIMDIFKKQGDDIKIIFKETQKISRNKMNQDNSEEETETKEDNPLMNMSPEKRDKLLRVINKLKGD